MHRSGVIALIASAVLGAGCTNPYDPTQRAVGGGLIGAGTGATSGALAGGGRGAAGGALAGGRGGAAIGAVTTPTPPQYGGGYGAQPYQQSYQQPYQQQGYAPPAYYPQGGGGWQQGKREQGDGSGQMGAFHGMEKGDGLVGGGRLVRWLSKPEFW